MKKIITLFFSFAMSLGAFAQNSDQATIDALLDAQVTEWNKGSIEGYMKGYWDNDSLLFIGKDGPVYGYKPTLERYKKSYPDAKTMGKLSCTNLSLKKLSEDYYFVVGRWEVDREKDDISGSYTLLIRKINGKWFIVADHSS